MGKDNNDSAMTVPIKVETVGENDAEDEKIGNKNGNKEDENLESLLSSFGDGGEFDIFAAVEEKEDAAALERRRKRKRRLEILEVSADTNTNKTANKTTIAAQIKKEQSSHVKREKDTVQPIESSNHGLKMESVDVDEKLINDKDNQDDNSQDGDGDSDSDSDDSDMFGSPSSEDRARKKEKKRKKNNSNNKSGITETESSNRESARRQDGFDDSDGYYRASIGETMELEVLSSRNHENEAWDLKLRVLGIIGKGVFSSVLKCSTATEKTLSLGNGIPTTISLNDNNTSNGQQQQHGLPSEVAIKCIRSNETMAKTALNEMKFLIRLRDSPGIVPLLLPAPQHTTNNNNNNHNPNYVPPPIDFRGHTILVFPYLPYNLRDVLQKFGKGVGLSLGAVKNYYKQLLSAAIHLQKQGVIHADIKPDNILVSADFSRVLVADFGSAFESRVVLEDETDGRVATAASGITHEAVTPYLVSRFYRAPEIILGLQPLSYAIDLWSLAVTAGELFLGNVLLRGASNNNMLYSMMELLVSRFEHLSNCFVTEKLLLRQIDNELQ